MSYRSTILYLLAALVLAGLYFFETRREQEAQEAEEEARALFHLDAKQVERIAMKRGGETLTLAKSGVSEQEQWRILTPVQTAGDGFEVTRLAETLAGLKYERVISETPGDLSPFGLDKPPLVISFKAGSEEEVLSLGGETPLETGFYVAKGGDRRVFLITPADKESADKDLFHLRDKRLFTLDPDGVVRMVLDRGPEKWILEKKDDQWRLEGNEDLPIDKESLESVIRRTVWQRASSFEEEDAKDLTPYGLDQPRVRILLSDGRSTEELLFGKEAGSGQGQGVYAKLAGSLQVVTINERFLKDLPQTREDLRQKAPEKEESGVSEPETGETPTPVRP